MRLNYIEEKRKRWMGQTKKKEALSVVGGENGRYLRLFKVLQSTQSGLGEEIRAIKGR